METSQHVTHEAHDFGVQDCVKSKVAYDQSMHKFMTRGDRHIMICHKCNSLWERLSYHHLLVPSCQDRLLSRVAADSLLLKVSPCLQRMKSNKIKHT